ncbi:MAG: hypothetical protein M1561_01840 [Gammaproteobacteria bacterium]|nr:hypothetical protein [Gammaproteobacteria bacterium]
MTRLFVLIFGLVLSGTVFAVCPVCTFAVGAGIGLTQWLGIDDTITGIWTGGLTVSVIIWTISWLDKKNYNFAGRNVLVWFFYYFFTFAPLYFTNIFGHALNKFWGVDKLVLGIALGSIVFFIGAKSYEIMKKHHDNKAYFPFQKVVMPIAPLIILSVVFYYLTK